MSIRFNLYSSEGCHLCDEALALYLSVFDKSDIHIIDIVDDDKLVELYGVHIPVLENNANGHKLFWPFSVQEIKELLKKD